MNVRGHNVDKHMPWLAIFPSRLATVMHYLSVLYRAKLVLVHVYLLCPVPG